MAERHLNKTFILHSFVAGFDFFYLFYLFIFFCSFAGLLTPFFTDTLSLYLTQWQIFKEIQHCGESSANFSLI